MSDEIDRNAETHTDETIESPKEAEQAKPSASASSASKPSASRGRKSGKKKKNEKKKYPSFTAYLWGEWVRPLGTIFIIMGLFRLVVLDWFDVPSGSMEPTVMTGDRIVVNKSAFGLRVPFTKETWIMQWGTPNRGDMVVCYSPDEGDEVRLVKRIVAVPGDTIEMIDGRVYINGQAPDLTPVDQTEFPAMDQVEASKMDFFTETVDGRSHYVMFNQKDGQKRDFPVLIKTLDGKRVTERLPAVEVPEGQYVIIGDNRDNSKDARGWNDAESLVSVGTVQQTIEFMDIDRIQGRAFAVAFSLDGWVPRWGRFFKDID